MICTDVHLKLITYELDVLRGWLSVPTQYLKEFCTFLIYILRQLSVSMQDVECPLCSKLESKGKIYFKQSCLLDRLTVSEFPSPHTNPISELGGAHLQHFLQLSKTSNPTIMTKLCSDLPGGDVKGYLLPSFNHSGPPTQFSVPQQCRKTRALVLDGYSGYHQIPWANIMIHIRREKWIGASLV